MEINLEANQIEKIASIHQEFKQSMQFKGEFQEDEEVHLENKIQIVQLIHILLSQKSSNISNNLDTTHLNNNTTDIIMKTDTNDFQVDFMKQKTVLSFRQLEKGLQGVMIINKKCSSISFFMEEIVQINETENKTQFSNKNNNQLQNDRLEVNLEDSQSQQQQQNQTKSISLEWNSKLESPSSYKNTSMRNAYPTSLQQQQKIITQQQFPKTVSQIEESQSMRQKSYQSQINQKQYKHQKMEPINYLQEDYDNQISQSQSKNNNNSNEDDGNNNNKMQQEIVQKQKYKTGASTNHSLFSRPSLPLENNESSNFSTVKQEGEENCTQNQKTDQNSIDIKIESETVKKEEEEREIENNIIKNQFKSKNIINNWAQPNLIPQIESFSSGTYQSLSVAAANKNNTNFQKQADKHITQEQIEQEKYNFGELSSNADSEMFADVGGIQKMHVDSSKDYMKLKERYYDKNDTSNDFGSMMDSSSFVGDIGNGNENKGKSPNQRLSKPQADQLVSQQQQQHNTSFISVKSHTNNNNSNQFQNRSIVLFTKDFPDKDSQDQEVNGNYELQQQQKGISLETQINEVLKPQDLNLEGNQNFNSSSSIAEQMKQKNKMKQCHCSKVLIVDSDVFTLNTLMKILEVKYGLHSDTAENLEIALKKLQKFQQKTEINANNFLPQHILQNKSNFCCGIYKAVIIDYDSMEVLYSKQKREKDLDSYINQICNYFATEEQQSNLCIFLQKHENEELLNYFKNKNVKYILPKPLENNLLNTFVKQWFLQA